MCAYGTNKPNSYVGISLETYTFFYDSREFTRIIEKTRESGEFLVNRPIMLFPARSYRF